MKTRLLIGLLFCLNLLGSETKSDARYIFFLHNQHFETHDSSESQLQFGQNGYKETVSKFENSGFKVITELRRSNYNARESAIGIVNQIDSLINNGTQAKNITIVGNSSGRLIAEYVSTFANNAALNFVFTANFQGGEIYNDPEINYCGNILVICEKFDYFKTMVKERIMNSTCESQNFKLIGLNTRMTSGFFSMPRNAWLEPTIEWANGNYTME